MSLKLILLSCLIGATISLASSENDCDELNDSYKWWEASDKEGYLKSLKYLGDEAKSITKNAEDLDSGCDSKKWKSVYSDAVGALAKVYVIIGKVIDNRLHGLGSLFSSINIASLRIYTCLFQTDKLRSSHVQPDICTKADYGSDWGCYGYSGSYSSADEIFEGHNLANVGHQVDELLNNCTDGKGVEALDENIQAPIGVIKNCAVALDDLSSINAENFIENLAELFNVIVDVCNNLEPGYGLKFVEDYNKLYKVVFLEAGYPDVSSIEAKYESRDSCGAYDWISSK